MRKETITAKSDKEISIKATFTPDYPLPVALQEEKIDLTKPYDRIALFCPAGIKASKVKEVKEDDETITVGKTKFKCKVITRTYTYPVPQKNLVVDYVFKAWICPDAV